MNKVTKVALRAEDSEAMPIEFEPQQPSAAATGHPTPKSKREERARYALLLVIAVLAGWLGVFVHNAINDINANLESTRQNLLWKR